MRPALLLTAPRTFELAERADAAPPDGQVAIDVLYTGVCGTDLHIVEGAHPRATFPLAIGHELVGYARGGSHDGQLVVVDPLLSCGVCAACRLGEPHVCMRLRLIGIDVDGGLAGRISADPERLHVVPAGLGAIDAVLTEPLAVAVHAARRASLAAGATVVVVGAGPIGVLLALVSRRAGAARIMVAEPSPTRRAFIERLGFELLDVADPVASVRDRTGGSMADLVFDAAAVPAVAAWLPAIVRPTGTVSLVGVYGSPPPIDLRAVVFGELTVRGNRVYTPDDIDTALAIIARRELDLRPLVTDVVSLRDAAGAIERLAAGDGVKYLVDSRAGS